MSIRLTVNEAQAQAIGRLVRHTPSKTSIIYIPSLNINLYKTKEDEFIELPDDASMIDIDRLVAQGLCSIEEPEVVPFKAAVVAVQKTKSLANGAELKIDANITDNTIDPVKEITIEATLNLEGFDNTVPGDIVIPWTVNLPEGWIAVDAVALTGTVTVTVKAAIPPAYASTNALANSTVTVANGTSEADALAELDEEVGVVGTKGEEGTATITWTITDYDGATAGDYTATGVLTLLTGWTGTAADVTATVTVNAA